MRSAQSSKANTGIVGSISRGTLLPIGRSLVIEALPLTLAVLLALYAGRAIAFNSYLTALAIAASITLFVAWSRLSLAGWCILLILSTLAVRGPVAVLELPGIVSFLHYAVVGLFCLWVWMRPSKHSNPAPLAWLVGFLLLVSISFAAGLPHPVRTLLFVLIVGEPLVVVWAVHRCAPDPRTTRSVAIAAIMVMALQVPWGLYQGLTVGFGDPVQGTLTGQGAGHHLLGALFAICLFLVTAALALRRIRLTTGAALAAVCFGMMLATAAVAVTILGTLCALLVPLMASPARTGTSRAQTPVWGFRISAAMIAATLVLLALSFLPGQTGRFDERVRVLARVNEAPEVSLVLDRIDDPMALFFGSGPGTTSSRASILLALPPGDSPVGLIGLPPTRLGIEYAYGTRDPHGGSAERFASGALGVIGDLGLLGFAGLMALFVSIWRHAGRTTSTAGLAVKTSLLMITGLLFLDNWLEYPEFAVPWAILVAFAIAEPDEPASEQPPRAISSSGSG
jgi:hypothetical protein